MQVTKMMDGQGISTGEKHPHTEEELQREYNYFMAEQMTKKLLEAGLITVDEFNKIMEKNRQTFSPFLAEIMPEMT